METIFESKWLIAHDIPNIGKVCQNLKTFKVTFSRDMYLGGDWIKEIKTCIEEKTGFLKLQDLRTQHLDWFNKSDILQASIPTLGPRLTNLEMTEIWKFKYSNFFAIRQNCPNLTSLTISLSVRTPMGTSYR